MTEFTAELHCHSDYSRDCDVSLLDLTRLCRLRGIKILALTDHNEIAGAVELAKTAPKWLTVIVGEEIATAEGDVIGLYLTSKIPARLPIAETIQKIRDQGGLALVPHPFDRVRHEAIGSDVLESIKGQVDAVEVFNSRCIWPGDNRRAADFVAANDLVGFVGSDAHTQREYGRSTVTFAARPTDARSFQRLLASASFNHHRSGLGVHLETWQVKRAKRRSKN